MAKKTHSSTPSQRWTRYSQRLACVIGNKLRPVVDQNAVCSVTSSVRGAPR